MNEKGAADIKTLEKKLISTMVEGDWDGFVELSTKPKKFTAMAKGIIESLAGAEVASSEHLTHLEAFEKYPKLVVDPKKGEISEGFLILKWIVETQFGEGEVIQCFGVNKISGRYFIESN